MLRNAQAIELRVREWRRHIHAHPELGMETEGTAAFVEKILKAIGVTNVRRCGRAGVVALIEGRPGGSCVGLRADMDALPVNERNDLPFKSTIPGAAHVCGHDVHTACLLGTAQILHDLRSEFCGMVKLIFQPGEEGAGGAAIMIADGALRDPAMKSIFALHVWPDIPAGTVGIRRGAVLAGAQSVEIRIQGKQGHAAHPHRCVDPILIAGHVICGLQAIVAREMAPLDTGVLSLGKITGGTAGNIIPEEVFIEGTIRALSKEVARQIAESGKRIVEGTAAAFRGSGSFKVAPGLPPLVNDDALFDMMEENFARNFGEARVRTLPTPSMGGEDFTLFLEHVPGAHFRLGVGQEGRENFPLHSPDFVVDESGFSYGVAGLAILALSALKS
ncbi:MAG: amidohydrolase [Synergistaceae bacterium]|jgi:amidohydrolase|nr:amidohydrolase [Synergistaceae bacterium]